MTVPMGAPNSMKTIGIVESCGLMLKDKTSMPVTIRDTLLLIIMTACPVDKTDRSKRVCLFEL